MALTTVPASLSATALTLTTAAQPNITSVGTLTGLTVSGNIAGTLTTAAQTNITSVGTLSSLTVSGALNGTLSTAAQTNITSLGTLSTLAVNSGTTNTVATFTSSDAGAGINLTDDSGTSTLQTNGANLRVGVDEAGAVSSSAIQFRVDGSTKATLDSNGNLGVGAAPVSGYGHLQVRGSFGYINEDGSNTKQMYLRTNYDTGNPAIQVATAHDLLFATSNVTRMTINSSGVLSLGPDAQDIKITPASFGSNINSIYMRGNASGDKSMITLNHYGHADYVIGAGTVSNGLFHIGRDGSTADISLNNSGNVGINNDSPETKLDISRGTDNTVYSTTADQRSEATITVRNLSQTTGTFAGINFYAGAGTGSDWSINNVRTGSYAGDLTFKTRAGGGSTDWRERMRILNNGSVGIGTTNPLVKLTVAGPAEGNPATSGTTQANASGRFFYGGATLDIGHYTTGTAWIVNSSPSNLSTNRDLSLLPNGGKVGIGIASPAGLPFQTKVSSGDNKFRQTTASRDAYTLGLDNSTGDTIIGTHSKYPHTTFRNGGNVELADGDVKFASGHGIDFSAVAGVGAVSGNPPGVNTTSSLLDDYEEGTFNAQIQGQTTAGAFNYTLQQGRYTKVGRLVSVVMTIYFASRTQAPAGNIIIKLPFTASSQNTQHSFYVGWAQYITFSGTQLAAYAGGNTLVLRGITSGGSGSVVGGSDIGSAMYLMISGTFYV